MNLEWEVWVGMLVGDTIQPITQRQILNIIYGLRTNCSCGFEVHPLDPPWQDLPQIMRPNRIPKKPGQN